MAIRSHGERLSRLEKVVEVLAEDQLSLQKLIADLARETRRNFDRVAEQFAETDRRMAAQFAESDRRMRETDKRLDERVDKLVVAIGEFIRRQNGKKS